MDEYTRPATIEDLKGIVRSLNDHRVPYLLIGGYALFAHGLHRATEDIDLLIAPRRDVAGPLIQALLVLSDQAAAGLEPEWFEEGENIRLCDEVVVDIHFKTCGETYDSLLPFAEEVELDGVPIRTLNLEGLLRTKQSLREKDKQDWLFLETALAYAKR